MDVCLFRGLCLVVLIAWTHGQLLEFLCNNYAVACLPGETCRVFKPYLERLALPRCVSSVPAGIDVACLDEGFRETVLEGTFNIVPKSCRRFFPPLLNGCPLGSTCIDAGVCCFDPNDGVDSTDELFQSSLFYDGRIYLLSNVPTYDARLAEAVCESRGGYLAEIETAAENAALKAFVATGDLNGNIGVLISGTDAATEDTFLFHYTGRTMSFFDWNYLPDNLNNTDCIQLIASDNFLWDDIPCVVATTSFNVLFLCEIP